MADEIEKKYRLTEPQKQLILEALTEIGAKFEGEDAEENILFTGGNLSTKSAVLRLRRIGERTILTYKQKVENGLAAKHYIEYETAVTNFKETVKIFEGLGYRPAVIYEKKRKTWNFRRVEIVLDELPFGDFMEIEGSIADIAEAEMFLRAQEFEVEYETYPRLTERFGVGRGDLIVARF